MNRDDLIRTSEKTIEAHRRFYLNALESGKEIKISSLVETYKEMKPLLHDNLDQSSLGSSVFKYTLDRLPDCIYKAKTIFITQSEKEVEKFKLIPGTWQKTRARSRRRVLFFNRATNTLICFITSSSDIDDLVNTLIAYQIEWGKLKGLLKGEYQQFIETEDFSSLGISQDDWEKIKNSLGKDWQEKILSLSQKEEDISLFLFKPTWMGYRQIAQDWWNKASQCLLLVDSESIPIYFVSSNLHSLVNIVSGYVAQNQNDIFNYIEKSYPQLAKEWQRIKSEDNVLRVNDFLYYISKIYFRDFPEKLKDKIDFETTLGINTFNIESKLSCGIQMIPVSAIAQSTLLDPHLKVIDPDELKRSKAFIININYPLGFSAYFLLSEILENLRNIKGIYMIGKAAILTGGVGDFQIPKVVFDENTGNFYFLKNVFNEDFPLGAFKNAVLKDQKSVSVYGTFLENQKHFENYTSAGFNIVEMESGPYLTAITEFQTKGQFPSRVNLHLDDLPFDLGIINYASDNPISKRTLGEGSLALEGIEATYLALLTTVQRIINLEEENSNQNKVNSP